MSGGDVRHSTGRRLRKGGSGLVVLVLVAALASHVFELGPRWLGWDYPSPVTEPSKVAPPPGLTLPTPSAAPVVASAAAPGAVDPTAVRRALRRLLRDEDLGPRVAVSVGSLTDAAAFSTGPDTVTPASTMKLLTTTAALATLGPDHTFRTTVVAGASPREVVLVGGGDPLLARTPSTDAYPARADIVTLAKATARSLEQLGRTRVRVGYDASLFTGPSVNPAWPASYVPDDVVSPISALWVDEGREGSDGPQRSADPALAAATAFANALSRQGIVVRGEPRPTVAPTDEPASGDEPDSDPSETPAPGSSDEEAAASDGSRAGTSDGTDAEGAASDAPTAGVSPEIREYAAVESAPVSQIAQWVLEVSDNEAAEVLFRHVALAEGQPGSFAGGSTAVPAVLDRLGVDLAGATILDGSGLSRRNRLDPDTLLGVLSAAASPEHPELRAVATGLPVAGFTGSLTYRFGDGAAEGLGLVRAKTGTLTGVHGLAGLVTDAGGAVLSFVAVADRVAVPDTLDAREQLDGVAAALAACDCST